MRAVSWVVLAGLVASGPVARAADGAQQALRLRIEADDPNVELFRHHGRSVGSGYAAGAQVTVVTTYYEPVCKAPCDVIVPNAYPNLYFLGGVGVATTGRFSLADYHGEAAMKVEAGSSLALWGGYTLATIGSVAAITGGTVMLFGASEHRGLGSSASYLVGGGLLALASGIVLAVLSATEYSIEQGPAAAASAVGESL